MTVRTLVVLLATVCGAGYAPVASGTVGSLVALPLLPLLAGLRAQSVASYGLVVMALLIVAVWSAGRAEEIFGGHDHSRIVIDEVAGMVVAGAFLPGTWLAAGIAFVVFRVFDVLKPFPANVLDRRPGGIGVVGDDVVAGAYAGLVSALILRVI